MILNINLKKNSCSIDSNPKGREAKKKTLVVVHLKIQNIKNKELFW